MWGPKQQKMRSRKSVLFDFQDAGVRRRAQCTRRGEECSRTKTVYNIETHTSDLILNTFWNWKPIRFSRRDVEWR